MHKLSQLSWKHPSVMVKKVINRFFPATMQQTTPKQLTQTAEMERKPTVGDASFQAGV